jgi:hypothetical protein
LTMVSILLLDPLTSLVPSSPTSLRRTKHDKRYFVFWNQMRWHISMQAAC